MKRKAICELLTHICFKELVLSLKPANFKVECGDFSYNFLSSFCGLSKFPIFCGLKLLRSGFKIQFLCSGLKQYIYCAENSLQSL